MKEYDDKHIKNIVLTGATKSGKTTLAEAMLFEAGLINRRGTVEEKNTISDFHDVEHDRGSSVYATSMHTEWKDYKINVIDTPGLDDFIGEVISSLRVADTAVMLLNAENGVEVGTELIWNYVEKFQKPILFAINHIDHNKSDFDATVESAKRRFGKAITLMQYPVQQGDGFDSIIDLLNMVMYKFPPQGGKPQKLPIPPEEKEKADKLHNELVERAAENDEKLMELYFEKGSLEEDQLRSGIKLGMLHHDVYPVFCLSAKKNMGSGRIMSFIDNVVPSATELFAEKLETVTLERELSIVKDYLALEKIRFEERLNIEMDIDENTLNQPVPPMMLQTLVENAIKHGVSKKINGGIIRVKSDFVAGHHELVVQNSGQLNGYLNGDGDGFGVKSTKDRLNLLYQGKATFDIKNLDADMVESKVIMPVANI